MSEIDESLAPEMAELVSVLRGAGPSDEVLARVRANVVGPGPGTPAGGGAKLMLILGAALAVALPPGPPGVPSTALVFSGGSVGSAAPAVDASLRGVAYAPPARPASPPEARALPPLAGSRKPGTDEALPVPWPELAKVPDFSGVTEDVPPSEAFANGVRQYANEAYLDSVATLLPVIEGRTQDSRSTVQRAWFFLARALYHLGLYHSSAVAFDAITREGEAHPHFEASLPWLAKLAERIPEPSAVIESIGRYRRDQLSALGQGGAADEYERVLYLLGRDRYAKRDLSGAVALFRELRPGSEPYVQARFYEGVSHVRMRRARPAVRAFRDVIAAIEEGEAGDLDDPDRMRDLAWLSLARVYYSAANRHTARGDLRTDERLLNNAVDAWNRVPEASEYWLDATFEQSWALFVAGQSDRALGRIHALLSPYFEDRHYPEAYVLRAVVLFQHCQLDASEDAIASFHARYDTTTAELRALLERHREPRQALALLRELRSGRSSLRGDASEVARSTLTDRELLRHLAQVDSMAAEEQRLAHLAQGRPRIADASAWLAQELAIGKALAADRTGELASGRLERAVETLQDRMNEIDAVQLEIHTERRRRPEGYASAPSDISIVADQEHMIWPFDGEYWRDELPYYRVHVPDRCTR